MKNFLTLICAFGIYGMSIGQMNTFPWFEDFESQASGSEDCGDNYTFTGNSWMNGDNTSSTTHEEDWRVTQNETPSDDTGPEFDHTTGGITGKYVYCETSCDTAGYPNVVFELVSPPLDFSNETNMEVIFWTHMYGDAMGNLTVQYELGGSGNWVTAGGPFTGNVRQWQQITVLLAGTDNQPQVRIRFQYISGASFTGDLALDDILVKPLLEVDLEATAAGPSSLIDCEFGLEDVNLTITETGETGLAPGDTIVAHYDDGTLTISDTIVLTDSLGKGETYLHTFSQQKDFSVLGDYHLEVSVSSPMDLNPTNDTLNVEVKSLPLITLPYVEDFESGQGGWHMHNSTGSTINGTWAFGTPTGSIINGAASGVNSFMTGNLGNAEYDNSEISYVESPCFDFSNANGNEWFTMNIWYESEFNWDGTNVTYSVDSGATWDLFGSVTNDWYNHNNINTMPGGFAAGWSGRDNSNNGSGGWINVKVPINATLLASNHALFRINFASDESVTDEGFAFDDIIIAAPPSFDPMPDTLYICGSDSGFIPLPVMADTSVYSISWSSGATGMWDTITTTGSYAVTATDTLGFSTTDYFTVVPFPAAPDLLGPDITICIDDTLVLDAGPYHSYSWSTSDTTQTITVIGGDLGEGSTTITLEVTGLGGCSGTDDIVVTVDSCIVDGIFENKASMAMRLFPNPTSGMLQVNVDGEPTGKDVSMLIFDLQSRAVMTRSFVHHHQETSFTLDLSDVAKGTYIIRLVSDDATSTKKLIIR